ncbi:MAG: hypothetical protein U1G07_04255 [Verrucomicrobiota bacterium]
MKTIRPASSFGSRALSLLALVGLAISSSLAAAPSDLIELSNGDRYAGTVLSVNLTNVSVHSEIPRHHQRTRAKVPESPLETRPLSRSQPIRPALKPPPRHLRSRPAIGPERCGYEFRSAPSKEMLSQAGPEAARKYSELMRGLAGGSINVNDLKKQAQRAIQEAEALKQDLGPEVSELLDGYLSILQKFVEEEPAEAPPNASVLSLKSVGFCGEEFGTLARRE